MFVYWRNWLPSGICPLCDLFHGGIFDTEGLGNFHPPLHDWCRCYLEPIVVDEDNPPPDLTDWDWDEIARTNPAAYQAWIRYVAWMLRREILIPLFLLALVAAAEEYNRRREEKEQEEETMPDPPPTTAPTVARAPAPLARSAEEDGYRLALATGALLPAGAAGDHVPIRVVRAGRTNPIRSFPHGITITAQALQDGLARGLFDGAAVFFRHVLDDGDVRDLAGVTHRARWDEEEQAVVADVHPYHNNAGSDFAALARDFAAHRDAGIAQPDVGVSMDSFFTTREGEPPQTARMTALFSVDIVFRPAADGRILAGPCGPACTADTAFLEQDGTLPHNPYEGGIPMPAEITDPQEQTPAAGPEETTPAPVLAAQPTPAPPPSPVPLDQETPAEETGQWFRALRESTVAARLAASDLPRVVQNRLLRDALASPAAFTTPQALDEAIDQARAELAALAEENVINIGGTPPRGRISAGNMHTGLDQLGGAVDWLFGVQGAETPEPNLRDARTLYHTITGDYEFQGMFRPERVVLTGATTTTLADLAANAMNKVIVQQFSLLTFWRWYEQITYPTPNDGSVQDMQWTVLGGIENLPTVPEKGAYDELDMGDVAESDSFVKYGGYVPITLELIRNSNIQRLQAVPRALAVAAVRTRSAKVSAIFTTASGLGPTLEQDSTALFDASAHSNLLTTAIGTDETAWKAVANAIFQQTEVTSGKPLALFPKYGLFPVELYHTALSIFGYGDGVPTSYEPFSQDRGTADPRPVPLVVPDWTDANNWAAIVDPMVMPVIHISYAQSPGGGSHPAPELYTVASPTAGLMFSNDVMPIKIRDWFAVGVNGWRGIHKSNVA